MIDKAFPRWFAAFFLLVLALCGNVLARGIPYGQLALHFAVGFPQAEFKRNVDRLGYGLAGQIEGGPKNLPWILGLAGGFIIYGSESRREPFSSTIPDVTVKVDTDNNLACGHFYLKVMPKEGTFRPYVMGLAGFQYLFTETKIEDINDQEEEIASSTILSDWTWSYGIGGGLQFQVYEGSTRIGNNGKKMPLRVLVGLQVRYLRGGKAEYLKEGSIRRENGQVIYDISRSETDLLFFQVGVAIGL